jgi:guanylate kinase
LNLSQLYPGLLFTLVGPAGVGKNTVMNGVLEQLHDVRQFPTATSRPMRDYEQEGREHYFYSRSAFETMIADGALLEHQEVHGNLYGIPQAALQTQLEAGHDLVADIDMHGARRAREAFPENTILIFVTPPSAHALAERMRDRGEPEAQVGKRLLRAPGEMSFAAVCDYVILNADLDSAISDLIGIIDWECKRRDARLRTIAALRRPILYEARMLLLHGDAVVLNAAGQLPARAFDTDTPPQIAALRAAADTGLLPPQTNLTTAADAENGYIPPLFVDHVGDDAADCFVYYYAARLPTRAALAQGWEWERLADARLPEALRKMDYAMSMIQPA